MIALLLLAAAPPQSLTLDQALELLERDSPAIRAERSRIAVAEAERVAASVLPNPSLGWSGQELIGGESTGALGQHAFTVSLPLLVFGQRGKRLEAAELGVTAERARVAAVVADRRYLVRQAFFALLVDQQRRVALDESVGDLERAVKVVTARAAAGDRSRYDVERIDLELRARQVERIDLGAQVEQASGALAAALGLPEWHPHAEGKLEQLGVSADRVGLWAQAVERLPALKAAQARQSAARGALEAAQRDAWPVPAVTAGAQVTRQVNGVSLLVGLGVPLPVLDRNQGPIARAAAGLDAEGAAVEAQLAAARAQIDAAAHVLVAKREALTALERDVVPRLPGLRVMAEDAYREGRAGILELLDAQRSIKEARLLYLQQLEDVLQAEAAVISAAGLDTAQP